MTRAFNPIDDHLVGLLDAEEAERPVVDPESSDDGDGRLEPNTFGKLVSGTITLALLIAATYLVPGLERAQPWRADEDYVPFWNVIGRELMGQGAQATEEERVLQHLQELARLAQSEAASDQAPLADREVVDPPASSTYPAYASHAEDATPVEHELELVENLDSFYAALTRTDLGYAGAVTRAGHWGDSVLGNDGVTAAIRNRMQSRFGDAGHGFHALTQYNLSYKHKGIRFDEKTEWSRCVINQGCRRDGHYGYGGVTVGSSAGAESRFATADKGAFGRRVSRFELWYAGQPGGGKLRIGIDRARDEVVETGARALEDGWAVVELEDGPHELTVRAIGGGRVRAYGVVLERAGPGVVWDGMPLIGSFVSRLSNFDPDHLARQLERRDPDLLVFTFGGNDMEETSLVRDMSRHERRYAAAVEVFRRARPDAACLIISPLDHGERQGGRIVSRPIVAPMVQAQRAVAAAAGCAYFDLYAAMGGEGSMGRWFRANPRLGSGDLAHPTAAGHVVIGELVYRALMKGYADFRRRVEGDPIP